MVEPEQFEITTRWINDKEYLLIKDSNVIYFECLDYDSSEYMTIPWDLDE